jgi:hypothetical protein
MFFHFLRYIFYEAAVNSTLQQGLIQDGERDLVNYSLPLMWSLTVVSSGFSGLVVSRFLLLPIENFE